MMRLLLVDVVDVVDAEEDAVLALLLLLSSEYRRSVYSPHSSKLAEVTCSIAACAEPPPPLLLLAAAAARISGAARAQWRATAQVRTH